MLTWDPANGFQTRTSGQTDVIYFVAPMSDIMFGDQPGQIASWTAKPYGLTYGITANEVASGTVLGDNSLFNPYNWFNPSNGETGSYFGIDAYDSNGNSYYGWVQFSTTSSSITIDAAYMNTTLNQAVTVGEIAPTPEPSTIALAGIGGLGMLGLFRRRKQ